MTTLPPWMSNPGNALLKTQLVSCGYLFAPTYTDGTRIAKYNFKLRSTKARKAMAVKSILNGAQRTFILIKGGENTNGLSQSTL
jgi:hypothetical protein